MSPKRLLAPGRRLFTSAVILLLVVVILGGGAIGSGLLFATTRRSEDLSALYRVIASNAHLALQQNIDARYDDCIAGDQVRIALYDQTATAAKSDALLYRLLPSLNTAEVHELVKRTRAKQLKAFAPRGFGGCAAYALRVAPKAVRGSYHVSR